MPTIKLFREGEGEFVETYASKATDIVLVTKEKFDSFIDNDDHQIIGFFRIFSTDLKKGYRLVVDSQGQTIQFGMVDDTRTM